MSRERIAVMGRALACASLHAAELRTFHPNKENWRVAGSLPKE